MKYFKKPLTGEVFAYEADGSQDDYILQELVQMTQAEIDAHLATPEPTISEKFELVRQALQAAIDLKAKEFGFSGGNALILYAGFTNAFQSVAQQFAVWEVSVWVQAESYKQGVIAGDNPMVSTQQAVEMMPPYS